jgi:lambda family phage tail tape measure protein
MQQEAFDKVIANLERLKSDETKILADRNRMIAALESQGVMTTRQAADARIAAQEDFADRFAAITFDQSRAAYRFFNDNQFRMRASEHRSLLEDDNLRFKAIEQNDQDVLVAKAARDAIEPQLKLKDLQQKILLLKEHTEGAQRKINTATKLGQVTQKDAMEFMEAALYDEARQLQAIRDELSALHLANPFDETIIRQLTDVDIKIEELRDSAAELREEFRSNHDAIAGMTDAFKDFAEKSTEHGRMFGEATTRAFNGMTEALTDFTMTGEADFKKLANSIVRDLIRIQVQSQIVGPISGVLGGFFGGGQATTPGYTGPMALANGGVMSGRGAMSLKSYAYGGIANSPQLALFGEGSTPEAFVPLPDGRRIPVVMSGNTGASNVVVNVNMESGQSAVTGDDGALLGKAVANAVQAELIKQKRPGGILS